VKARETSLGHGRPGPGHVVPLCAGRTDFQRGTHDLEEDRHWTRLACTVFEEVVVGSHIPFSKAGVWLRAARSIWLATAGPSGRPHAAPVWFVWDGRSIYLCTGPTTVKHRNLQHQPAVIAHLGDGDDTLIIEGHAAVVADADELASVDRLFRGKYVDPHSGATAGYPQSAADVPYRIDIDRMMIWEYGVVATRTDFIPGGDGGWIKPSPG
jgi:nitroimidazol reductase NimA-like FMN-containing flavoprotein (pyridoxamine 5'-phosphate oxidase superfamily)